ncbi:prolipoprotein diacylglyceryl transferase [Pollutibacter soli]|uniref:prolipoprotein diacylglyceryl transferase n=1 Tax=Pollutibacter soli TaxID=3034157 RepID=UPI003013D711
MYPNLYYFLKETFNITPWNFTQYINSFGFFVAIAFVVSALMLTSELKRKEKQGLLSFKEEAVVVGEKVKLSDLIFNIIFGFIVGYKIIGVFFNNSDTNPQEYIFSSKGSWIGGILLAALFSWVKYREKKKQELPSPEERKIRIWPHERVGDIIIIGAIAGFVGAKIFDNLENWDRFIQNPIANLLSPSGLTFYGGLILAAICILTYARRKHINLWHLLDSTAPVLMIAYAIGRIGCHVSGDGDWGIFNSAYTVSADGDIIPAAKGAFESSLNTSGNFSKYLIAEFGDLKNIPHAYFHGSEFLPNWFWAYNFPHNVNEVGVAIPGCTGNYCNQLVPPVFPTTLYEIITCTILFLAIWFLRKRIKISGRLFAVYLVLNGFERFFIEKIRVNTTYNLFGFHPTQAELISTLLILGGLILWFYRGRVRTA